MSDKHKKADLEKDAQTALENAAVQRGNQKYVLRLYVSGITPRSTRAIENIRKICEENLKDRYQLEVIDVYQQPDLARSEQIIAAPTLIKELPLPLRKFIGDLSDTERILVGMEIKDKS